MSTMQLSKLRNLTLILSNLIYYCYLFTKLRLTLLQPHWQQPARLLCPWDFPGKNTGVGFHFLLQRFFLSQGLNPHVLHYTDSFTTEPPGKPLMIWKDYPVLTNYMLVDPIVFFQSQKMISTSFTEKIFSQYEIIISC